MRYLIVLLLAGGLGSTLAVSSVRAAYAEDSAAVSSITITEPHVVEQLAAGQVLEIEWDWTGTDSMANVNIYASFDAGLTYDLVAANSDNDGSYAWILPNIDTDEAYLKIEGTDLVTVLASDISAQFQISTGEDDTTDDVADDSDDAVDEEDVADADDSDDDGMGPSPVTGELEAIDDVSAGDYVKSPSFDTVYWVDADMVRHPFWDAQTYFTYEDSFDVIVEVSDATLPTLTLGSSMLPKAGVVLVKIQSDDRVYALEEDGDETELRWIADENIAVDSYGDDWADYVIDIDVTLFTKFTIGTDVWMEEEIDTTDMETRSHLADLAS